MRGGRVGFIENRARLAQHHHARRMTVLRELWYCHVAVLSFHASSPSNPPRFPCAYPFLSDFRGQFWRSSGTQTGSCGISSESSRRPLSNDVKFARIGVRTRELWLPEVGVSELFSCTLPVKIPVKRGMLSANREFHDVAGVIIFPTHPGSRINLLRAGKTLRAKAAVREKKCVLLPARFFSNLVPVPDSRESELGLVRYGPASRVHRGVFGPFEGSFPIRIPADPDKFLAIREFHVVHGCVLFPMCPGSQINLLRVRKTLCASAATSVGKFRKFQHSLISSACFHARGRRSSRCWILTILVSSESLRYLLFNGTSLAQRRAWVRKIWYCEKSSSVCVSFSVRRAGSQPVDTRVKSLDLALRKSVRPSEVSKRRIGLGTTQVSKLGERSRVRIGLGDHPGLETETNRVRIGLGDHPGLETKFVIWVRIGLGDHPGLETETNRGRIGLGDHPGLETKFVIRVRIGLGDHPGLETETNRGRIGLGDHPGLETKFVIRVRIGLGDHPGLETKRGRIGLGDHPGLETEIWIRVRIGLGDHPGLETKFVIRVRIGLGDHPGLETETNRGRIGLGDHPGLETKFVIRMSDRGSGSGGPRRSDRLEFLCHASSIEVVVALSAGSECTRIPYFRLSYLVVLTTCFWSLAHLVGLSDTFDHLVGRHFLKLRSVRLNLQLFQLIPDGGSISLISGLSSNFSVRGKIAPVWYNRINGETYGQIKGLFHIFSNPGLFSYCYSGSLIPELRYYHRFGRFCRRCPFAWMM
uniref:Uncharacterized protein n=1 Tax=Fagus sylvatica TaxID=28930 RepID=A0A2N9HXW2_FAGSY